MAQALVLGGGGPLGVGWQAGLRSALVEAGRRQGRAEAERVRAPWSGLRP